MKMQVTNVTVKCRAPPSYNQIKSIKIQRVKSIKSPPFFPPGAYKNCQWLTPTGSGPIYPRKSHEKELSESWRIEKQAANGFHKFMQKERPGMQTIYPIANITNCITFRAGMSRKIPPGSAPEIPVRDFPPARRPDGARSRRTRAAPPARRTPRRTRTAGSAARRRG